MPRSMAYIHPEIDGGLTDTQLSRRLRESALCWTAGSDRWFPTEPGADAETAREMYEEQARLACAGCPVQAECLVLALRYESRPRIDAHGIWGGLAPWERETLIRSLRRRSGGIDAARTALGVAS